jgi:hypothetical protein
MGEVERLLRLVCYKIISDPFPTNIFLFCLLFPVLPFLSLLRHQNLRHPTGECQENAIPEVPVV